MLLGVTVLKKKYPLSKYLCVLLIVTGVALFMYKPKNVGSVGDEHIFGYGELLLVSSKLLKGKTKQKLSGKLPGAKLYFVEKWEGCLSRT